ncbi:MAG: PIN domain nuclease [Intrasporangiaceae bacterium]|nr:PIN domain nuclease [Intrasporangiaceae bacterium]
MILVDTSVWVDLLRGGGKPATRELERRMSRPADLACTEPVAMELLAGGRGPELDRVERLGTGLVSLTVEPFVDYRAAAGIYRLVRGSGHTVHSLQDCLIAAIAIRHGVTLLDHDRDYERISDRVRPTAGSSTAPTGQVG